jgi:hypothetical protein
VYAFGGFSYEGTGFSARQQVVDPPRCSFLTRRSGSRGATAAPVSARTTRSAPLATLDDVASAIKELHQMLSDCGRDPADITVQLDAVADAPPALARRRSITSCTSDSPQSG